MSNPTPEDNAHGDHHAHVETGTEHGHVHHEAHGNKNAAILIATLAACLALSETAGKSAQTEAVTMTIAQSDTWNFYQAKTIRSTVIETARSMLDFQSGPERDALDQKWAATLDRYKSDPKTGEGREELRAKAEHLAHEVHLKLEAYHRFELSSAAFQIAIVLASSAIVTGIGLLTYVAIAGGAIGLILGALGSIIMFGG
jgi:hypothetical protein